MKHLNVISIELVKRVGSDSSSSTGHTVTDKFKVTFDNGKRKDLYVDIWYLPKEMIRRTFEKAFTGTFGRCDNMEDAYSKYLDAIANISCPWSKEEILNIKK